MAAGAGREKERHRERERERERERTAHRERPRERERTAQRERERPAQRERERKDKNLELSLGWECWQDYWPRLNKELDHPQAWRARAQSPSSAIHHQQQFVLHVSCLDLQSGLKPSSLLPILICLSVYLSVCPASLFVCLSVCLSCLSCLSVCLSVCLNTCLLCILRTHADGLKRRYLWDDKLCYIDKSNRRRCTETTLSLGW